MNGDLLGVRVEQRVDVDRPGVSVLQGQFRVARVVHEAQICEGHVLHTVTLLAPSGERGSQTLYPPLDDVSAWPAPPGWFDEAVRRLRLEVEEWRQIKEGRS